LAALDRCGRLQSDDDVRDLLAGIDHAEIRVEKFASEG
jgi:hypothetical protein